MYESLLHKAELMGYYFGGAFLPDNTMLYAPSTSRPCIPETGGRWTPVSDSLNQIHTRYYSNMSILHLHASNAPKSDGN